MCENVAFLVLLSAHALSRSGAQPDFSGDEFDKELSPQTVATVPFGGASISVWEHINKKGMFYAQPLGYLKESSAREENNIVTGQRQMNFDVVLWSEEAKDAIFDHLRRNHNASALRDNVNMMPISEVRVSWQQGYGTLDDEFQLQDAWRTSINLPNQLTFSIRCPKAGPKCTELVSTMKTQPSQFSALALEYIVSGKRAARRVLTVTTEQIVKGRLFTQLANLNKTDANGNVYLKSDDAKEVAREAAANSIALVATDADYVNTGNEIQIRDVVFREIERNQITTDNFEPQMWDSVFWDPSFARPDKITKTLNDVLERDASDTRHFYLREKESHVNADAGGGGGIGIISGHVDVEVTNDNKKRVKKEDIEKMLRERFQHTEWTGEAFRVKPMKLSRLNIASLKRETNFATTNIQIRQYASVSRIPIRTLSQAQGVTATLTPEVVQTTLRNELQQLGSQLNPKIDAVSSQVNRKVDQKAAELAGQIQSIQQSAGEIDGKRDHLEQWTKARLLHYHACPPDWTYTPRNTCVKIFWELKTWAQADEHCRSIHGWLAKVDNVQMEHLLMNSHLDYLWIGLHREADGQHLWRDGTNAASFQRFRDGTNADCFLFDPRDGEWVRPAGAGCNRPNPYYCEGRIQNINEV